MGTYIEAELNKVDGGKGKNSAKTKQTKQERLLQKLLGLEKPENRKFRDPKDMLKN